MKKFLFGICIGIILLISCGAVQADAAQFYKERASVTFHNESPYYVVDGDWIKGMYNAELRNGTLCVSVEDFKNAFNADISYNYDDLTVTLNLYDQVVKQTLYSSTLYVNSQACSVAEPYISPASGNPVMIALEPFASTMGYKGVFETKPSYLSGEMTLRLPQVPYTLTHVEINQAAQLVTVFGKSPSGMTEPLKYMLCSTGVGQATPNGTYRINPLGTDWYYFSNFGCFVRYCSQITGNICFHSLMFNGNTNATLSRTAYNVIGTKASHGCVRLFVEDARFIHQNCGGLPVVISSGYTDARTDRIRNYIISGKPSYEEYVKSLN